MLIAILELEGLREVDLLGMRQASIPEDRRRNAIKFISLPWFIDLRSPDIIHICVVFSVGT